MIHPNPHAPRHASSEAATQPTQGQVAPTSSTRTLLVQPNRRQQPHREPYGWLIPLEAPSKHMPLFRGRNYVGSSCQVRLKLRDGYVSKQHFVITCGHGAAMIEDLNSTNGTWVNGRRVQRQLIASDDLIIAGKTRLRYQLASASKTAPRVRSVARELIQDAVPLRAHKS